LNVLIVSAVLVGLLMVALAGAVRPYRRSEVPALEPMADPLEDRRLALLLALRDLETARGSGALEEDDYARLRSETEGRMARVLRAIDERAHPAPGNGSEGATAPRNPTRVLVVIGILAASLAVALVPNLLRSVNEQSAGDAAVAGSGSITFFEQRVRQHPHDLAARLDLAHRYLDLAYIDQAYNQYVAALALEPRDVEALSHMGIVLHLKGRPHQALSYERRALRIDPTYPEGQFFKGVILFKGLDRPADAVGPLKAYLDASPYGAFGEEARKLLADARREAGR
jgi:hypothetical protein